MSCAARRVWHERGRASPIVIRGEAHLSWRPWPVGSLLGPTGRALSALESAKNYCKTISARPDKVEVAGASLKPAEGTQVAPYSSDPRVSWRAAPRD